MKAYQKWGKQKLVIDSIEPTHYVRNFLIFSTIKKLARKCKIKNICEIGCGVGILSYRLGRKGFNVDAFDLDKDAINLAKKYSKNKNVNFFSENILNLSTNKKYDLILVIEVLEHIKNDVQAIKNINKMLSQKSFVLLTVPINEK